MATLILRPVTTVEASELGLEPGKWPQEVKHEGWTWTHPVFKYLGSDLLHVSYTCNGRKLVVVPSIQGDKEDWYAGK